MRRVNIKEAWRSTYIVIPTGYRHKYLQSIFLNSGLPKSRIMLIRTIKGKSIPNATNIFYSGDLNIHKWWNLGISEVENRGGKFVFVLSDDIEIERRQLEKFLELMIDGNKWLVHGNTGKVFWGHAFLLNLDSSIRPDERFVWWYGDFDLARRAKAAGKLAISEEKIKHIHVGELTKESVWLTRQSELDLKTWYRKYPIERFLVYPRTIKRFFALYRNDL